MAPSGTAEELIELQKDYLDIRIHPMLIDYIARIVHATRTSGDCLAGVSPRGTLALLRAVRAYAMVQGRSYVVPEDIKTLTDSGSRTPPCLPVMPYSGPDSERFLEGSGSERITNGRVGEII